MPCLPSDPYCYHRFIFRAVTFLWLWHGPFQTLLGRPLGGGSFGPTGDLQ